ncbi:class I SAM-dependent methyltransferase [Flavisericum labens]|uniref:class I SAM-dependent methyltransferase n=1 Tax=Flavisericum labens TaxID=3377112 RepID=UPI00387B320E
MDDFDMKGELLRDNLDEIAKINRFLGGNRLTIQGVQDLLIDVPKSREVTIVDVGCGNGDMLRIQADYGLKNNWSFRLIGIDANDFTISHAKQLSKKYSNISYQCVDIFEKSYEELQYDIVLCTLTLHHFKDDEIIYLLRIFYINTNIGIVINDLHRNIIAYRLYQGF